MEYKIKLKDTIINRIMVGFVASAICFSPFWGPALYMYLNRDSIKVRETEQERLALEREEKRKDLCSLVEQVLRKAQYEDHTIGLSQKDMSVLLENLGYEQDVISRLCPNTFSLYVDGKDFFHRNHPALFVNFLYENGKFLTNPITGEKEVDKWNLKGGKSRVDEQKLRDYLHKNASR